MTRAFTTETVDPVVINDCVELASRSPSAGKSQGWHLLVLEGIDAKRYWDIAFPIDQRKNFVFPGLLDAPVIALSLADPGAYLSRYSEADKQGSGLGESLDAWVAPYWTIDASFATMTFLLAIEDAGFGALFFAHANEEGLRQEFSIPDGIQILGSMAIGRPSETAARQGRSASRTRRSSASIIHRSRW